MAQDQATLVNRENKSRKIVIRPEHGYTVEAVVDLLRKHEAVVHDNSIVVQCTGSEEGYRAIASIVEDNRVYDFGTWDLEESGS